jgi:hypothetical protein
MGTTWFELYVRKKFGDDGIKRGEVRLERGEIKAIWFSNNVREQ